MEGRQIDKRLLPVIFSASVAVICDLGLRFLAINPDKYVTSESDVFELASFQSLDDDKYSSYIKKLDQAGYKKLDAEQVSDDFELAVTEGMVWNAGRKSYRLLAVFQGLRRFAVLISVDNQTSEESLVEIVEGQQIEDYVLTFLGDKSINFQTKSGEEVELRLFDKT